MPANAKSDSRTGKSVTNLLTGILSQLVILVLNFAVRYLFIQKIGYEYLGINSLFSSILTVLSVADLGFGSALGIVLYSSLAKKNEEEIAGLMNFFKKVYLIIGLIVTAAGLAITPFVKYLVNTSKDIPNLSLYFLLFLLNTVSSYFISYRAILIRADQKNSVVNNVTTVVKIAKAALEVAVLLVIPKLMGLTATYISYLGVMVVSTYAIGIITAIYARDKYPYAFKGRVPVSPEKKKDIISTTKDLFIYRLCSAFSSPIDSIIISIFVGTLVLGIYSNYLLIFTTLLEFICLVSRNVISSVGNFVVERPLEEQKKLYFEMQIVYFAIIIFCTINFVSLASPFISLVFKSENTLSMWTVFLMGLTLISRCIGELNIIFRETTKIYRKTKYISLFYTFIHVGLSLLLGYFMGLEGILLGNVIAYFLTNFWFELFALFKWYFKSSPAKVFGMFAYVLFITCGISVGMYLITELITSKGDVLSFILSAIISLVVSSISLFALYPIEGFPLIFKRFKRIAARFYNAFIEVIHKSAKIQIGVIVSYIVILTALILFRDIYGANIHKLVFFALFVVAVLLCNKQNALIIILLTLPISPSLAELYIIIFSLLYLVVVSFKSHSIKSWLLMFSIPLLLFVLEIVLSLIYGVLKFNLALRILLILSFLSVIFYDKIIFGRKHLLAFIFGVLYLFAITAINWIVPAFYGITHRGSVTWLNLSILLRECRFGFSTLEWITKSSGLKFPFKGDFGTGENPNNVGLLSIVCMASIYCLYGTFKNKGKIFSLLLVVLFILFGFWSQSRTFLLLFGVFILVAILLPFITKRRDWVTSLIYLHLVAIAVVVVYFAFPNFINSIIKRFSEKTTSSGGGRITLIADYFKFLFSDWRYALFGVSCSNLEPLSHIGIVPHTNFIQFIGSYGIIGLIIFLSFLVVAFTKTKSIKLSGPQLYLFMPVTFAFLFTLTLQLFLPSIVLISFIPGVLCLSFANRSTSKEKEFEYLPAFPNKPNASENLRLAMCSTSFGGGIASYIVNITPHLIKKKTQVSFVYNPDTTDDEKKKYEKIHGDKFSFNKKRSALKIIRLQRKFKYYLEVFYKTKPHLIYINASSFLRSFILIRAAQSYRGAKIVIHCHNPVNANSKMSFSERVARFILTFEKMTFFACSKESGFVFFGKSFMKEKNKNDAVVTNFIDVNQFKYNKSSRNEIRKLLKVSNKDVVLGNVGRFEEQKNQKFIVDLMSKLPNNHKAIIVGGGGTLKQSLIDETNNLKVNDRVILIDGVSDIEKYYCAFDYFVLPSLAEGLPFVSVEAQCSGVLNVLNEELPNSTKITDRVIFLPLDVDVWVDFFKQTKPIREEYRAGCYKLVDKAGFSSETAPNKIIEKIKSVVYE